ncbi:MAG: sodium-dependent transporter [Gammaproteobacteria bacterium]|nr:sodium-dependent transporter [Gammaproteobacteria bacterium]
MTEKRTSIHGQWSSRMVFILAATGSAVGLGNIWKFPYMAGENGGGAFVLVYLVCILLIGVPIMMAEILLGRRGRQSPINTMSALAQEAGASPRWAWLGWIGVVAGFLIMSFYSVIAGWALAYVLKAMSGDFVGFTGDSSAAAFVGHIGNPGITTFWHTLFSVMTGYVVARGVKSGLEKAVRILMPALFVLLVLLLGYAINTGYFDRGVAFLFDPDFGKLSREGVLSALGHAFFTLSLGMGAIMVYGSYMPGKASIATTTFTIAFMDTLVALVAGMAIFPIVFANGLEPGAGPGLVFISLPIAFGQMPGGLLFGTLFFVLLTFAAWTSAISIIEPAVAFLVENRGLSRRRATAVVVGLAWALGLLTVMSFGGWGFTFEFAGAQKTDGIFDILDIVTTNFMLPLGGLAIALFAGWVMSSKDTAEELGSGETGLYHVWRVLVRFVAPAGVLLFFLHSLGTF